jgi:hypothetical protein
MQPGDPSLSLPERPRSAAPSYRTTDPALDSAQAPTNGYGVERYGTGSGYANSAEPHASRYGPAGYGGFVREDSNETVTTLQNKQALFGDAQNRINRKPLPPSNTQKDTTTAGEPNIYGDRQLTAEEEEEEDVAATKQEIRFSKQSSVSSTRNALQVAAAAETSGLSTLGRLSEQGERLYNTQKNLDLAMNHNLVAAEKARELKTINSSMFAIHVANPFNSMEQRERTDWEINEKYRQAKQEREVGRQGGFLAQGKMGGVEDEGWGSTTGETKVPLSKSRLAERSLYSFEADDEDEELENELDGNLDALGKAAGRLNLLARAVGQEVESQQPVIDQISTTVSGFVLFIAGSELTVCRGIMWVNRLL